MSADTPRPIWLSEDEINFDDSRLAYLARLRFHAAPANPTEAVADVLDRESGDLARERHLIRDAVLRALGHPDA